jgi:protein TonB
VSVSGLGNFSQCLVDGDPGSLGRARRRRKTALTISLILEAWLLASLLLWPLITPGVLPRQFNVMPTPPFHGGGNRAPKPPRQPMNPPPRPSPRAPTCRFCQPPEIPPHPSNGPGPEPPSIDANPGTGSENDSGFPGSGPFVPGGFDSGKPLSVSRPPEQPHPSTLLSKSEGVMEAMLVRQVQPEYPPIVRAAHISGTVQLRAIIAKDGTVRELQVISGNPLLVKAARAAVLQWRYRPTLLNGEPVEVETYITANFVLE